MIVVCVCVCVCVSNGFNELTVCHACVCSAYMCDACVCVHAVCSGTELSWHKYPGPLGWKIWKKKPVAVAEPELAESSSEVPELGQD